MALVFDPQVWLSFLTLAVLEIVLGVDNIIFLVLLVNRLPVPQRRSAQLLGLSLATLTRIALLYSVVWLATLTATLFTVFGDEISGRDLILFAGGAFLAIKSVLEIRDMISGRVATRKPGIMNRYWPVILQISVVDILFSLDSVFTAVGLAQRIEVMVAAIVAAALVMMWVSSGVGRFIERYPSIKLLGLAFLVLVGAELIAQALDWNLPQGYLYVALGFAVAVESLNLYMRRGRA